METRTKLHLIGYGTLVVVILLMVFGGVIKSRSYEKKIFELQNIAASKDKTIELKDGLYHKLALQTDDLKKLLDQKDAEYKSLIKEVNKRREELLSTTDVILGLKEQIVQLQNGQQTHVPGEGGKPDREKIDFHNDFGFVKVDGWTMTNPPQSWVRLSPGKPLKLNVTLTQSEDKAWHAYAGVSDDRIGVDIAVAGVNPYLFKPKWYEGIGVMVGLGAGTNQSGVGALVSLGITYKFRQFTLGPAVWLGINNVVDKYYGLVFEWRPFEKVR